MGKPRLRLKHTYVTRRLAMYALKAGEHATTCPVHLCRVTLAFVTMVTECSFRSRAFVPRRCNRHNRLPRPAPSLSREASHGSCRKAHR